MNALNKNYINTAYQGFYEIYPNEGFTADNTFSFVNRIIHTWVTNKYAEERIPQSPRTWSWSGISRSIDIHHDYDNRIYSIKVSHTDEKVANRIWTVEATVFVKHERVFLATRTSYTSDDRNREYQLCNPAKFVDRIAKRCRLCDAGDTLDKLHMIKTVEDVENLFLIVNDIDRVFPVIIISEDQRQDQDIIVLQSQEVGYHIDGAKLAYSLKYLAHVYYLPKEFQDKWTEMMSVKWGVVNGAVRTYNAGFDIGNEETMSRYDHPVAFPNNILAMDYVSEEGEALIAGHAFRHILTHRIKRDNMYRRIDWDELDVKYYDQILKEADIASEKDLDTLKLEIKKQQERIKFLQAYCKDIEQDKIDQESEINKKRSENFINQQRIYELTEQLKEFKDLIPIEYPKTYREIPDWVSQQFAGRLELHKRALKCLKDNPVYPDIELLCKAIEFLGKYYYEMKTGRLDKKECDEIRDSLCIENSPTGSVASAGRQKDAYYVDYDGRRRRLEMHVKGGKSMNSSEDSERFRIYYFWDDDDQRVVVGYLPGHLHLSE